MRRSVKRGGLPAVAAAVAAVSLVAGCGGAASVAPSSPGPGGSRPSPSPSASPSSPPQASQAQVGDTFTIKGEDGTHCEVTLLQVVQQAAPASEFDTPAAGKHLAAAEFHVTAISAVDENANNDATTVGTNEQVYTAALSSVAEGTNFANGDITLQPGGSLTGWVAFELPDGVNVAKVVWTPSAGFSSSTAEWVVPGSSSTPSPAQTLGPAATVRAYFAAISAHNWPLAWRLGGRNTGTSYADFVRGHSTTVSVTVTILGVAGDVVTARIVGVDTEGTSKTFEGQYAVNNGVIVHFDVHEVG